MTETTICTGMLARVTDVGSERARSGCHRHLLGRRDLQFVQPLCQGGHVQAVLAGQAPVPKEAAL